MKLLALIFFFLNFFVAFSNEYPLEIDCTAKNVIGIAKIDIKLSNISDSNIYIQVSDWMISYRPSLFPENTFVYNFLYFWDRKKQRYPCAGFLENNPTYHALPSIIQLKPGEKQKITIYYFGSQMLMLNDDPSDWEYDLCGDIRYCNENDWQKLKKELKKPIDKAIVKHHDDISMIFLNFFDLYKTVTPSGFRKYFSDISINDSKESSKIRKCFYKISFFRVPYVR